MAVQQLTPKPTATGAPNKEPHLVKINNARTVLVVGPLGCSSVGALSFIGGGSGNVAGGIAAAIVGGNSNDACETNSTVTGGTNNVIGGNDGGLAYSSAVLAGIRNGISGSAGAMIGGGLDNIITNTLPSPYYNSNLSAIGAGYLNVIGAPNSFIGAGTGNSIVSPTFAASNLPDAFIGAGYNNQIDSDYSAITGGYSNVNAGEYSTIGGGYSNFVSGQYASVSGGNSNSVSGEYATIGGGFKNNILLSAYASLGGGDSNLVSGEYGVISGGYNNVASGIQAGVLGGYGNTASGRNAAVPGGAYNTASGLDSFAAGNSAKALNDGAFVWSDYSSNAGIVSTAVNQFVARAAGGFYLYSSSNLRSGVRLAPGSGSWANLSDRAVKSGIESVDQSGILAKVAALPVSEWSYSAQGVGVRHIGPMAQDFRAAFGLGEDDKHISTVDEEGVALAAIKALQAEVVEKNRKLANLDTKFTQLESRLEALERKVPTK